MDTASLNPATSGATIEKMPDRRSLIIAIIVLAIGIGIIASATDAFFDFAAQLHSTSPAVQHLDQGVHDWCVTHRNRVGNLFFLTITQLGSPVALIVLALIATVVFWRRKKRGTAVFVAFTTASGYLIDLYLKDHYQRARPLLTQAIEGAHGYSFPSGHAMGSACVVGAFAYLAARSWGHLVPKILSVLGALIFIALVCWSRVYIGVHWLTDVLAGAGLGFAWLIVVILCRETLIFLRDYRKSRQPASA